jgi:ABC-2 type transport system permease protein
MVTIIPPNLAEHLQAYADEQEAQRALASGGIAAYYVIPADYVMKGELFYVYPENRPLTSGGQSWVMLRTILANLAGTDADLAERVWNPMDLTVTRLDPGSDSAGGGDCSQPGAGCESSSVPEYLPSLMVVLFYTSFMINSNLLSESVGSERKNQTMEVLMVSIRPRQMLAGKIGGLGIAALLHTAVWAVTVFALFSLGGQALKLPPGSSLPPRVIWWGLAFFVLGFAIYASLMAGVGALAPKLKEASQASFLVLSPLMAGYVVGLVAPLADASQRALPFAFSLFPLTAPVTMIMRLTVGPVPAWQLLLSAGLQALTAYLVVRAVSAMFQAQYLLSGQPFSLRRYLGILLRSA